jgi:hypothetical protein
MDGFRAWAAAVCVWVSLVGCAASRVDTSTAPTEQPEDLKSFVLVIRELPGGDTTNAWMPQSEFNWPEPEESKLGTNQKGRVEPASLRQRDCAQEQIDCFRRCWEQDPPEGYRRHKHEHYAYCQDMCRDAFIDCLKATGQHPLEFRGMNETIDWLKRHRKEVLVGSIIVSAGLAFVVVSTAGGVLVLAPIVLF